MKRFLIAAALLAVLVAGISWAAPPARPLAGKIHAGPPAAAGKTWHVFARDTVLYKDWHIVNGYVLNQMSAADSVVAWSTNAADSTYLRILGIKSNDTSRAEALVRIRGTDTVRVQGQKFQYIENLISDTSSAGDVRVKALTSSSSLTTQILAGTRQTNIAHHFFDKFEGGVIDGIVVQGHPVPADSTIYYQVRLYSLHRTAIASPEDGYSVLWEGETRDGLPPQTIPINTECPPQSYVTVVARTTGTNYTGRIWVMLSGHERN